MDAAMSWGRANRSRRTLTPPPRSNEPGRKDTIVTAGNKRMTSVPVLLHHPSSLRLAEPSQRTQPCLLAPFIHHEFLKRYFVSWFVPAPPPTTTPPAHKPPASTSWGARRLRHEPFDESPAWKLHLPGHLRTGGRTPHFFEIWKSAKNSFNRLICRAWQ